MSNSPCVGVCQLQNGICSGCERTLHEIAEWGKMPMSDRMELMRKLEGQSSTHSCPGCGAPSYCAMEAGKSANTCWCMTVEVTDPKKMNMDSERCMCRTCLRKQ